jgi:carbon-monoxide dehydrogenase medium subunit
MKPSPFGYEVPGSLDEAVAFLADAGSGAKVLAGGQSLIPVLSMRLVSVDRLVDINRLPGLDGIEPADGGFRVGALVRQRDAELSPELRDGCPLLPEALAHVAHATIRNRGTVVGSLTHADPASELPAVIAVLGGRLTLASSGGTRDVPAFDFFAGPFATAARPDELVTSAWFPRTNGAGVAFEEVARRHGDFALCGVAALVRPGEARVAFTGVGTAPVTVDVTDPVEAGDLDGAADEASAAIEPHSDIHASAAFRRRLAASLCRRALERAGQAP